MSTQSPPDPRTVLTRHQMCAARFWGADAALTMAPEAGGETVPAAPELSTSCDAELSVHSLALDVVPTSVLAKLSSAEMSAVHAELTAAWEGGRDAVWTSAVRARFLRNADNVDEASTIERANESYVDSLRSSLARPDPDATW